jgi:hypothetical protein
VGAMKGNIPIFIFHSLTKCWDVEEFQVRFGVQSRYNI